MQTWCAVVVRRYPSHRLLAYQAPAVTAWGLASLLSLRRSVGAGTWEVVRVKSLSVFSLLTVRHVYACGRELR